MTTIGIDYTPAHEQGGGIGRYVRELISALSKIDTDISYKLFVAGAKNPPDVRFPENFVWKNTRLSTRFLARAWHRARLPLPVEFFTGPVQLFHSTDFVLPPTNKKTKTILTVHDLSFIRTPETASPRLRNYLNTVVPRSVKRADHILADSAATKADLMDVYGTASEKITVLLSGVNQQFHPVTDLQKLGQTRRKYQISDRPYIFAIGTVQPRKNYARLVQAISLLRAKGFDLQIVIAGGKGWLEDHIYHAIHNFKMDDYVNFIGYADDNDIPALYSGSVCSSFVSLYEGFGFPVLESMACGTPVITSNVSSIPEVAGDVAPMVDPTDVDALSDRIEAILTDTTYRQLLVQRGLIHSRKFTWEESSNHLLDVYRQVLAS